MGWINFKGQSSERYGIMKQVPYVPTAEITVDTVEIPYGTPVTIKKGYKRIITPQFTLGIKNMSQENIYDIYDWLHGEGRLITSREPDKYFKAQIYSALTTRRLSERLGELDFQFSCEPFRYAIDNPEISPGFTPDGNMKVTRFDNAGNCEALPEYNIEANGPFKIMVNGVEFSYGQAGHYQINVEYMSMKSGGNIIRVDPQINAIRLKTGQNVIAVSNSITSFKIIKNERWR